MKDNRLVILSNKIGEEFAKSVADYIGAEFIETDVRKHPDNELYLHVDESIRGADAFLICPYYPDPMERHTETLIMAGTIKDASAGRLTAVPTYLGFQRSDWKDKSRVPIAIKYVAQSLEAVGVDRVLTMHLHAPQIQGMFRIPFDVLQALPVLKEWCDENDYTKDVVVVSADAGGTKYSEAAASIINAAGLGIIWKKRMGGHDVDSYHFAGDVNGKTVLMPDDQLSTAGTLRKGAKRLKEKQGAGSVYGFATHGIFAPTKGRKSEDLVLEDEYLDGIVVTDTIPRPQDWREKYTKIEVRSVVKNFGDAIKKIHMNESLSGIFQY